MNDLTLQPGRFSCIDGPLLTIVMDGVGLSSLQEGNAVFHASTPHLDALFKSRLSREIRAHGRAVGLPSDGDLGNSEVGHNALGCGRIFEQGASLVEGAITSGRLFASETWQWLTEPTRSGENTLHFIGLVSDGNVHSHIRHLYAMVDRAAAMGVAKVRVHALLDGRDVGEMTALEYIEPLEAHLDALSVDGRDYAIASGGGRMVITMDRYDADWPMVERGWAHHVRGEGRRFKTASQAIRTLRAETGKTDQFLEPFDVGLRDIYVTPSIGIVEYPKDGNTVEDLIENADTAMFEAKERGRNTVVVALYRREFRFLCCHSTGFSCCLCNMENVTAIFHTRLQSYSGHCPASTTQRSLVSNR